MAVRTSPSFLLNDNYRSRVSWLQAFTAISVDSLTRRGKQDAPNGEESPPLTNQEAAALISAVRALAAMTTVGFAMWSQFAAVAYDWDTTRNRFVTSVRQMRLMYPADIGAELWDHMQMVITALDKERRDVPADITLDRDTFQSLVFVNDVKQDLFGFKATKKTPLPVCRDKKTGKLRLPRVPCNKDGEGPIEPITGRRMPCDKPGDCDPQLVDDPITAVGKSILPLVVGGVILWWLISPSTRRRR